MGLETHDFFQEKLYMHYTGSSSVTLPSNERKSREAISFTRLSSNLYFRNGWDTRQHIPKQAGLPRRDSGSLKEGSVCTNIYSKLLSS